MKRLKQRRQLLKILAAFLLIVGCSPIIPSFQASNDESSLSKTERSTEQLWSILEKADDEYYVILFRHAIAPGTGDPANFKLNDCSTQRNLSEEGRKQAIKIGKELKGRQIPMTRVLSSQWCRCLETAKLMDIGEVEPYAPLNSFFSNRSRSDTQTNQLRQFLLTENHHAGVLIMVTHQVNITAISGIFPQSGEGVVVQIDPKNAKLQVLGSILP